jgi:hypothetical protein
MIDTKREYIESVKEGRERWQFALYAMALGIGIPPLLLITGPFALYQFIRGMLSFRKGRRMRCEHGFGPVPQYDEESPPPKYSGIVTPQ